MSHNPVGPHGLFVVEIALPCGGGGIPTIGDPDVIDG
jgi:hypothetical protein